MNELAGGLAQWVSWLTSTLVAEELKFDSQPGQEIILFSDVHAGSGARSTSIRNVPGYFSRV
jgi:hypothetical protein